MNEIIKKTLRKARISQFSIEFKGSKVRIVTEKISSSWQYNEQEALTDIINKINKMIEKGTYKAPVKLTKANKEHLCDNCGKTIKKGTMYKRSSKSYGQPGRKDVQRTKDGGFAIVCHGITVGIGLCSHCATK